MSARRHLESLLERELHAPGGLTLTVRRLYDEVAVAHVGADGAGVDCVVLVDRVQESIDRLHETGEVPIDPDAYDPSELVLAAVLASLPGTRTRDDPPAVVLPAWRPRPPAVAAPPAPARPARPEPAVAPAPSLRTFGAWPPLLLLSCAAVALTTWGWTSSPARAAITTWFLLICPGMAVVRLLPGRGTLVRVVLAIATSLALETVLATVAVESAAWSPGAMLALLLVLTTAATGLALRTRGVRT